METGLYQKSEARCKKLKSTGLRLKAEELLNLLKDDPFKKPPSYEKLVGDLSGTDSRRINIHHRLVYQVIEVKRTVKIIRMWTHYE